MSTEMTVIANEITKTLVGIGGRLLESTFTKQIVDHQKIKEHIQRTTNQVGYFVTYRPSRQPIEAAYVEPWLVSGSLALSHVPSSLYSSYRTLLDERLISGEPLDPRQKSLDPGINTAFDEIKTLDLADLTQDDQSTMVLAEAGSGKTALLSYLCFTRLKIKGAKLPLFIDSQMLDKDSLSAVITGLLIPLGLSLEQGKELGSGLSLYLDGLDEIPRTQFNKICADLNKLAAQAPGLSITASCRSAAYKGELSFLREITIYPFDVKRSEAFIRAWYSGSGVEHLANGLIKELSQNERLSELGQQPLLLSLMCNAYRRFLKVSRRQSALYDQCLDSLLWAWDRDRDVSRTQAVGSMDLQKALWLHSRVAVNLHDRRERFASRDQIVKMMHRELPRYGIQADKAELVVTEFCANSGVLTKYTEDTFGFAHFGLQEALTAKWYASELRWKGLMTAERILDPWWREVIHLCAASLSDATDMINAIGQVANVSEVKLLQCVAGCLKQDPPMSPEARNVIWTKVLFWYHDGNLEQHNAACEMLVGIEDEISAPALVKSLAGRILNKATAQSMKRGVDEKPLPTDRPRDELSSRLLNANLRRSR